MKPVIIIAIAVVCSIAVFFGLSVFDVDDLVKIQIGIIDEDFDDLPSILNQYDCAETFDAIIMNSENEGTQKLTELGIDMFDNRCWVTVKSWANESLYESKIWDSDLELTSYLNQAYLGETQCKDTGCQKYVDSLWTVKKSLPP